MSTDKARLSLDELVVDLKKECQLLSDLEVAKRAADNSVNSCKAAINGLQNIIDARIKKLKVDVPGDSIWGLDGDKT